MKPQPARSSRPALVRLSVAAAVALAGGILLQAHPIGAPPESARLAGLAGFRVAFGLLLCFRLHRLRRALPVLWPSQRRSRWDRWVPARRAIDLWQLAAAALAVGLFTPVAALVCLVAGLYVFERSYIHSLEDVLFQLTTFFLVVVDAGAVGSIDALWGVPGAVVGVDPVLALDLWWMAFSLLLFSAGFEKLFSPLWRRGLGFSLFVGLPHLVQRRFRFLRGMPRVGWLLSWCTVVTELGYLPSALSPPTRLVLTAVLAGFACTLFLVVDLSFIGQTLLLNVALFGFLDLARLNAAASAPAPTLAPSLSLSLSLALAVVVVALLAIPTMAAPLGPLSRALARIVRFTVGLEPIRVFTDAQLDGIYLYRVSAPRTDAAGELALVETFRDDGSAGPLQRWHPRVFLKMTYEVTDLCRIAAREGWGAAEKTIRFQAATDLLRAGHAELVRLEASGRGHADHIILSVRWVELERPLPGPGAAPRFRVGPWHPLMTAAVRGEGLDPPRLLPVPAHPRGTDSRPSAPSSRALAAQGGQIVGHIEGDAEEDQAAADQLVEVDRLGQEGPRHRRGQDRDDQGRHRRDSDRHALHGEGHQAVSDELAHHGEADHDDPSARRGRKHLGIG